MDRFDAEVFAARSGAVEALRRLAKVSAVCAGGGILLDLIVPSFGGGIGLGFYNAAAQLAPVLLVALLVEAAFAMPEFVRHATTQLGVRPAVLVGAAGAFTGSQVIGPFLIVMVGAMIALGLDDSTAFLFLLTVAGLGLQVVNLFTGLAARHRLMTSISPYPEDAPGQPDLDPPD